MEINDKYKEFFEWEERKSIEPLMKSESKIELNPCDITTKIKENVIPNECKDTGKIKYVKTTEHRKKISESLRGRSRPEAVCKKISISNKGKKKSVEHRKAMCISRRGVKWSSYKRSRMLHRIPWNKGKRGVQVSWNKGLKLPPEIGEKIRQKAIGRIVSEETKRKHRLNAIKRIPQKDGRIIPSFNTKACEYFDKLMLENKCHIQHAMNDGEYHIKELGYWVDGYDKENNIVYEWDEKHHFKYGGTLKEKDINRQKEIEEFLKCKFIRIKEI